MHTRAALECGMQLSYECMQTPLAAVREAIEQAKAEGFVGLNVTAPLKVAAAACVDELAPEAAVLGSINTICFADGNSSGYNTDVAGFEYLLRTAGVSLDQTQEDQRAVVIGAGGAARAVLYALRNAGYSITVLARRREALDGLAAAAPAASFENACELDSPNAMTALANTALIVNASSAGMRGQELDSPLDGFPQLRSDCLLIDLVYAPSTTRLMAQARNVGVKAVGGLPMLAAQAAYSFALWTGVAVSEASMLRILSEAGHGD
jgi:shikimate dehydrogenase